MIAVPIKIYPEIPQSWLVFALLIALVILRSFGIDSLVTGALMALVGYITGKHVEQKNRSS